ncbi:MAG: beta-N-acetylglucosaminidase domain-containing protein [Clostridia bacterium]|nr:beta-N-acetylglucosaminidase domain-containing protein [Clostridia bacterium]
MNNENRIFSFDRNFGVQYTSERFAHILQDLPQGDAVCIFAEPDSTAAGKEGYRLQIYENADKLTVNIYYSDDRGLVYALCTVCRMCKVNRFQLGSQVQAPSFAVRGYIEGFYGRPWSHAARLDMIRHAASFGANTHYYGPKDDPYHRKLWRECYPEQELQQLRELSDEAAKYCMEFAYCIAPGLSICYASEAEFAALKNKILQLYGIGIRSFGLLLDDIAPELYYEEDKQKYSSTVEAHIDLINRTDAFLQTLDDCILTVCPTEYWGKGDSDYLQQLGKGIREEIRMFFTGNEICSKEITAEEAEYFCKNTNRKPLYWDNYPVNDAEMFMEMHMGPLIGRDKKLYAFAEGEIFNCMEYSECTKIPLATALTYLWDPEHYDPEQAYLLAVETNIAKEDQKAFILFADHLRTSCLKDENSRIMGENLIRSLAAMEAGNTEKSAEIFFAYLDDMQKAAALLQNKKDGIYKELSVWLQKFYACVEILDICGDILFRQADRKEELQQKMHAYNMSAPVLTAFCLREFAEIALDNFSY